MRQQLQDELRLLAVAVAVAVAVLLFSLLLG
jgi:hypothetical protein